MEIGNATNISSFSTQLCVINGNVLYYGNIVLSRCYCISEDKKHVQILLNKYQLKNSWKYKIICIETNFLVFFCIFGLICAFYVRKFAYNLTFLLSLIIYSLFYVIVNIVLLYYIRYYGNYV